MTIRSSLVQLGAIMMMVATPLQAADPIIGAWGGQDTREDRDLEVVVIFTEAHQVAVWFDPASGEVVHTNGGLWSRSGPRVTEIVEFDSDHPQRVGSSVSFDIELSDKELSIVGSDSRLTRIDVGSGDHLQGAWQVAGFLEDGEWVDAGSGSRTVRLMSMTRFQEIVYDAETGTLMSTRGGAYVLDGQNYGERVEFWISDEQPRRGMRNMVERDSQGWRQLSRDGTGRAWQARAAPSP